MENAAKDIRENFLQEIGRGFFGEYLIAQGLVNRLQLETALEAQKSLRAHLKIGELLVKRGALSSQDLVRSLKEYRIGIRLGELLIHQGDIGFIQLLEALDHQQATGLPLGAALVALGYCTAEQVDEVLSLQRSLFDLLPVS